MYEQLKKEFLRLSDSTGLTSKFVECTVLSSDFVKLPSNEYALMRGKEVIVHCDIDSFCGQAFTDIPQTFRGKVTEVADLALGNSGSRSVFFAVLNAMMHRLGKIDRTVHCRGYDVERCGVILAEKVRESFGNVGAVAHIGFQPGHIKATSNSFDTIYVTDLNPENVGKVKFGVKVLSGLMNEEVIERADVVCITGSTIVNGTLPKLLSWCDKYRKKYILYGVTVKGAAKLLGYEVFCPLSRDEL